MELGVGIVYRPGLEALLLENDTAVQVVEVEAQASFVDPGAVDGNGSGMGPCLEAAVARHLLGLPQRRLVRRFGLPVGTSVPPEAGRAASCRRVVEHLGAAWASELLGFDRVHGSGGLFGTGLLLPPRQTIEGVVAAATRIRELTRGFSVPFAIEPAVNYLRPRDDEMSDGAFVAAVATVADCGILLDLNTLRTNERLGREGVEDFLLEIPLERVIEVHLAGGADRHGDGPTPLCRPQVDLARRVVPALPNLGAIVCEARPGPLTSIGLRAMRGRLEALHDLWSLRRPNPEAFQAASADTVVVRRLRSASSFPPPEWERTLGGLVAGLPTGGPLAAELSADAGVAVLRRLAAEARGAAVAAARNQTQAMSG